MTGWYIVEARNGADVEVHNRLAAFGYEVFQPMEAHEVTIRWRGKPLAKPIRETRWRARFGPYLFLRVEMGDPVYSAVRRVKGVKGWLCIAGTTQPAPQPDWVVELARADRPQAVEPERTYAAGDVVRLTSGPFKWFNGVVAHFDARGIVKVDVSIFGRPTPIIIEVGHVELVEQGRRPPIGQNVKGKRRA